LNRARFSIKCIEGLDIHRRNDTDRIPRNDPFLKFKLGANGETTKKLIENNNNNNNNTNLDNNSTKNNNSNNNNELWKTTATKRKQD